MMKRPFVLLMTAVLSSLLLSGCGSKPEADYDSPEAVVAAYKSYSESDPDNSGNWMEHLEGKTFAVKTNQWDENKNVVYSVISTSDCIDVMLGDADDPKRADFDYKKGDTIVLEIGTVMDQNITKGGNWRQFYIIAELPD